MDEHCSHSSLTSFCLLAAVATPILAFGIQLAAAPFFPGYSFTRMSGSMLGTHFSRHPWIFNFGDMLNGVAALAASYGLYRAFRAKTNVVISALVGFAVATSGFMSLKAGLFPMPSPLHNSWPFLFNFTIIIPHLMLIGLWRQSRGWGLRLYLIASIVFLVLLVPAKPYLGRGTLQRLIAVGSLVPVGVVGFAFWRALRPSLPPSSQMP